MQVTSNIGLSWNRTSLMMFLTYCKLSGGTSRDTLSFVTHYIVVNFAVCPETLSEPFTVVAFTVATVVGDPVLSRQGIQKLP